MVIDHNWMKKKKPLSTNTKRSSIVKVWYFCFKKIEKKLGKFKEDE